MRVAEIASELGRFDERRPGALVVAGGLLRMAELQQYREPRVGRDRRTPARLQGALEVARGLLVTELREGPLDIASGGPFPFAGARPDAVETRRGEQRQPCLRRQPIVRF
jgi:hypothetical protein